MPWLFHVIYPGFICLSICPNTTWILQKFNSWNFHGMSEKMIHWISLDLVSFSIKLPSKWNEKLRFTFFTGMVCFFYIVNLLFRIECDSLKSYIMYFNFTFHKVIKVFAQMVHANSMCCGQGVRLVILIYIYKFLSDN